MLSRDFIEENSLEAIRQYFDSDISMEEFLSCYDGFKCSFGFGSIIFHIRYGYKAFSVSFLYDLSFYYEEYCNHACWICVDASGRETYFPTNDFILNKLSSKQRAFVIKNIDIFLHANS